MIKKLQKKFIMITMTSVFLVFAAIFVSIAIILNRNIQKNARDLLEYIAFHYDDLNGAGIPNNPHFTQETPYETRFFTIVIDDNNVIKEIDMKKIASVREEEAIECVINLHKNGKEKGRWKTFNYISLNEEIGTKYIFVDFSKQLLIAKTYKTTTVFVELVAFVAIFILVYFLSGKAIEPIANSYEKQNKFITDAGHELKTPLTVISANTELLEIENGESEYTETIKKQVQRLNMMTKNLVMLSKIEEGTIKEEESKFDISEDLLDICETYKNVGMKNNIEMKLDVEEKVEYIGNEKLIRELFIILIDNAIKYGKNYLCIKLNKIKNKIQIEFENDTSGIQQGDLDILCDRFYRTPEARGSDVEGSGIGLSIAKEIVEIHKGEMKIKSNDGIAYNVRVVL